jgi:hypothetical protein
MILYRVENLATQEGLWYNSKDQSSSAVVHNLELSARVLPMDFAKEIAEYHWKSAADSINQLKYWFNREDLLKLIPIGFNLYEIDADIVKTHTTEHYSHALFQENGVKYRKALDINILIPE